MAAEGETVRLVADDGAELTTERVQEWLDVLAAQYAALTELQKDVRRFDRAEGDNSAPSLVMMGLVPSVQAAVDQVHALRMQCYGVWFGISAIKNAKLDAVLKGGPVALVKALIKGDL
jgi:hypothetical protein